jgi:hypothetical protein
VLLVANGCAVGASRPAEGGSGGGTITVSNSTTASSGAIGTTGTISTPTVTSSEGSGSSSTVQVIQTDGGGVTEIIDTGGYVEGGAALVDSGVPSNLESATPPTCDPTACAANQCTCVSGPGGMYCAHACPGQYCAVGTSTPYCDCNTGGVVTCNSQ